MLNKYQFDPALDLDKLFQCSPPPKIDFSNLAKLPKDWYAQLEALFYQADKGLEKKSLERHLGTDSSYELKKILAEQLQLIYYRLQGHLDTELGPLSDDHRIALLNKLTEEITQCTLGFHNRVNVIVDSFQKPCNLDQLLYMLRKRIVEDVASSLTNEIHTWNQVSIIAAAEGLGIKPNFSNDPYIRTESNDDIRRTLRETFQKKFTPFNLPCLLHHALIGLIPELAVEKNREGGLSLETIEKIVALIKCYLPNSVTSDSLDWRKYFNGYSDKQDEFKVHIVDMDRPVMYRYFYQELSKGNYFKQTPKIHNLIDGAYYNLSLTKPDPTDHESDYINQLFEEKNYFVLLDQLEKLQIRFPDHYQRVIRNPILIQRSLEFIPYLQQQFPNSEGYPSEFMQGFHLLTTLDLVADKYVILQITDALLLKNRSNHTPLMFAANNDPNIIEGILKVLVQHQAIIEFDIYRRLFLEKNQDNWNALMLAVRFKPISAILMLSFFDIYFLSSTDKERKKFGVDLLQQVFLAKQISNYNVLMLAAETQAKSVEIILTFIEEHPKIFDAALITEILLAKDEFGTTALMLAAEKQPKAMTLLLNFINKHIDTLDIRAVRELLFKEIHDYKTSMDIFFGGRFNTRKTLLMVAERQHPQAASALLFFIDEHIGRLMLEKNKHPQASSTLDERTERLEIDILTRLLLEKDGDGNNPFMRACDKHPKAMKGTLNFIANTTLMESNALNNIQTEIANFIFMQLPRMSLEEPEEKTIIDKILLSNSALLLAHFSKDYFVEHPANLAYMTNQLFEHYLEELEERQAKNISYLTPFSFFTWRYSTREKMEAAKELKKIVRLNPFSLQQLHELEKKPRYYWPLTESRLGQLFAAYCTVADNAVNSLVEAHRIFDNNNIIPVPIEIPSTSSNEISTYLKHSMLGSGRMSSL
jgi:ankyrin repeat protein